MCVCVCACACVCVCVCACACVCVCVWCVCDDRIIILIISAQLPFSVWLEMELQIPSLDSALSGHLRY